MIKAKCRCGGVFEFPDSEVGQLFSCGNCGTHMTVPRPTSRPVHTGYANGPSPVAQQSPQPRRSRGCLFAVLTTLLALTLLVAVVIGGVFWVRGKVRQAARQISGWTGLITGLEELGNVEQIIGEFEEQGYERVTGQMVVESNPIHNKRIYMCQVLEVKTDIHEDVAIMAQAATIHGTVHGDLEFMGQALVIDRDAVIKGNVHSRLAQLITVKGTVEGDLTGGYQVLDAAPNRIQGGIGAQDAIATLGSAVRDAKKAAEDLRQRAERRQTSGRGVLSPAAPATPKPAPDPVTFGDNGDSRPKRKINDAEFPFAFQVSDNLDATKNQQLIDYLITKDYQLVEARQPQIGMTGKQVVRNQVVDITSPVAGDIAVVAQVLNVKSTIIGDLDFMGQSLTIAPGAVVQGNVRLHSAQAVHVKGKVFGEIAGTYQVVYGQDRVQFGVSPSR